MLPATHDRHWFRLVDRGRYRLLRGRDFRFEVVTGPGVIELVGLDGLWDAVGGWAGRDSMECDQTARRLYDAGRHDEWVHHPDGVTSTTAEVLNPAAPAD